jgi:hypothetical protein
MAKLIPIRNLPLSRYRIRGGGRFFALQVAVATAHTATEKRTLKRTKLTIFDINVTPRLLAAHSSHHLLALFKRQFKRIERHR